MRKLRKIKDRSKKKVIKYEDHQCEYRFASGKRCGNKAVGAGTLCKRHGGDPVTADSLIAYNEQRNIQAYTLNKYDPSVTPFEYLDYAQRGLSKVEIAAQMQVSPKTIDRWAATFKEFNKIFEIAEAMHESWYLTVAKDNLTNTRFQTGLFKYITTNKLGYAEKIETRNVNENKNVGVLLVPGSMSVDEWEAQNIAEEEELIDAAPRKELSED